MTVVVEEYYVVCSVAVSERKKTHHARTQAYILQLSLQKALEQRNGIFRLFGMNPMPRATHRCQHVIGKVGLNRWNVGVSNKARLSTMNEKGIAGDRKSVV